MTLKGEEITVKGEFQENIFNFNKQITFCYSRGCNAFHSKKASHTLYEDSNLPLFQMVFTLKGNVSFSHEGDKKPFSTIPSQQHNMILLYPEKLNPKFSEEEQNEVIYITFSPSFLFRYLPPEHPAYTDFHSALENGLPGVFAGQNMHLTPEISAILNSIDNSPHTGFCERLFMESKVIELLMLQISQLKFSQRNSLVNQLKRDALERMYQVREILLSNMDSQLPLRTLAHMVGTNEFNLKKHFKAAFGTTVYGYLIQHKMEKAKAMLLEGEAKVAEVSLKMGYKHATHFTSAFKKYFGYLPTKIKMLVLFADPEVFLLFSENFFFLES
ncbi:helix-turn-helix transcriptional regulator [Pedobacter sp. AW31-3R]|uniref:helix-turn-helix transcriptional regulator n=1 Tax=Pedobacter sp. AW31-3R TaxID=3445781 RepID=UPI003FA17345